MKNARERRQQACTLRISLAISPGLSDAIDEMVAKRRKELGVDPITASKAVTRSSVMRDAIAHGIGFVDGS